MDKNVTRFTRLQELKVVLQVIIRSKKSGRKRYITCLQYLSFPELKILNLSMLASAVPQICPPCHSFLLSLNWHRHVVVDFLAESDKEIFCYFKYTYNESLDLIQRLHSNLSKVFPLISNKRNTVKKKNKQDEKICIKYH